MDEPRHTEDYLARRRTEIRRRVRRRRAVAGAAILALVAAVGAALAVTGGDDAPRRTATAARGESRLLAPPAPHVSSRRPATRQIVAGAAEPPGHSIPILMYHAIEAPPAGAPSPELWRPRERFVADMAMLRSSGYHAITLREAYDYWKGRTRIPRKPIVLSFDDGYRSHLEVALPALRRLGWRGVLNMEVGALKGQGPEHITRAAVRALARAGWEIDAHTIDHRDLTTLSPDDLRYEVAEGRRQLRRLFGTPVEFFCYPAGKYDAAAIAEVRRAGFLAATTVDPGLASPKELWTLKRIRVNGSDTPEAVRERVAAAG